MIALGPKRAGAWNLPGHCANSFAAFNKGSVRKVGHAPSPSQNPGFAGCLHGGHGFAEILVRWIAGVETVGATLAK